MILQGKHDKVRPMWNSLCTRFSSVLWLFVPSALWSISLHSPIVCIDGLIVPAIEQRIPPKARPVFRWLWVLCFGVYLLFNWNIRPGTYLFYIQEALPFTPPLILSAIGVATVCLIWLGTTKNPLGTFGHWRDKIALVGIVLLLIKAAAASNIINSSSTRQYFRSPVMAGSRVIVSTLKKRDQNFTDRVPSASFFSFIKEQKTLPANVVLMVVESWGEKQDALSALADKVSAAGFQAVQYGFTDYYGSTLNGEFRELCGKYVELSGDLMHTIKDLGCAPQYLHDRGFHVMGVHGYIKAFYARSLFWDRFGLRDQKFGDDLGNMQQCPGPFAGVCDEDLIHYGVGKIDSVKQPAFLYMLTLSSHEPVETSALHTQEQHFGGIEVVHPTQLVTRYAISKLLDSLQARKNPSCTLVYVVGDHQPPSASGKGIFQGRKVPYLVFQQNCPVS